MAGRSVRRVITCAVAVAVSGWSAVGLHAQTVVAATATPSTVNATNITVNMDYTPLHVVLRTIAQQAGLTPIYGEMILSSPLRISLHVHDVAATDAFEKALHGTGFRASIVTGNVVFERVRSPGGSANVQGSISGRIVDAKTKAPLRGADVTLDGAEPGVRTKDDGTFRFSTVSQGAHTVSVRLLGYVKARKSITVIEGQNVSVDIVLEQSVSALDQVVVTGTIVPTEVRALPNAMTVITAKDIEQRGITQIQQLFRGDVPGLFAQTTGSAEPLDAVTMFSRGATQLQFAQASSFAQPDAPTNTIKTYVDGVELANPSYLSQIDPKTIERIEIIAGPQASTIYGSNAINGVMQIFTKRGTSMKPQVTATLLSGFVQNDYRSALTPQHDDAVQISGTEGHWSYNVGGSWNYLGAWTPAKQTARRDAFGGAHVQAGPWTADATLRLGDTYNRQVGMPEQKNTAGDESGLYNIRSHGYIDHTAPQTATLTGQTLGLTLGYTPFSWWSHELVIGSDVSNTESYYTAAAITTSDDTLLNFNQSTNRRTSLRYSTTARAPIRNVAQLVVTLGADGWQNLLGTLSASSPTLTGTLIPGGSQQYQQPQVSRQPGHNAGAFVQGQLGLGDAFFVTYGLRAEWNPNYGDEAQPNYAPRYGVAYTRDFETPLGTMTTKVRASYGRSTRPPTVDEKIGLPAMGNYLPYYGPFDDQLANPDLGPESQQGGEGGIELYFGSRASLIITRYNQTVDNLISYVRGADSVRSLAPLPVGISSGLYSSLDENGYGYYRQAEALNVGSIRNQGWELQGTVTAGPLTMRGTYSWTKSRVLGITPQYRTFLTSGSFVPGFTFDMTPEHTWGAITTYTRHHSNVSLSLSGIGQMFGGHGDIYQRVMYARLNVDKPRISQPNSYRYIMTGYSTADLNASQQFSSRIEGVLQVENLSNFYRVDRSIEFAALGRQTKAGLRVRF